MAEKPRWHPFLSSEERTPGVWTMIGAYDKAYGEVRIVRVGAEVGYVGTLRGQPVGRWTNLRAALEGVHGAFLRAHGASGGQAGQYPDFRA